MLNIAGTSLLTYFLLFSGLKLWWASFTVDTIWHFTDKTTKNKTTDSKKSELTDVEHTFVKLYNNCSGTYTFLIIPRDQYFIVDEYSTDKAGWENNVTLIDWKQYAGLRLCFSLNFVSLDHSQLIHASHTHRITPLHRTHTHTDRRELNLIRATNAKHAVITRP